MKIPFHARAGVGRDGRKVERDGWERLAGSNLQKSLKTRDAERLADPIRHHVSAFLHRGRASPLTLFSAFEAKFPAAAAQSSATNSCPARGKATSTKKMRGPGPFVLRKWKISRGASGARAAVATVADKGKRSAANAVNKEKEACGSGNVLHFASLTARRR